MDSKSSSENFITQTGSLEPAMANLKRSALSGFRSLTAISLTISILGSARWMPQTVSSSTRRFTRSICFANYPRALDEPFKGNSVASFLRREFKQVVEDVAPLGDFKVEGSPGKGNWARSPWVAVFDPLITVSAERGYYIVYLFRKSCGVSKKLYGIGPF